MERKLTVKVYSSNNGTVDISTMIVEGNANDQITKYFCVGDRVFKYEIYDELGNLLDTVNISGLPGASSTGDPGLAVSTWDTLTDCCNPNWLLTEDTENIICNQGSEPIILS
jgi:hypothetical protein